MRDQSLLHTHLTSYLRDQSRYAPSQWETSLHCNDVSHWLGTHLGQSLLPHSPTWPNLLTDWLTDWLANWLAYWWTASSCKSASNAVAMYSTWCTYCCSAQTGRCHNPQWSCQSSQPPSPLIAAPGHPQSVDHSYPQELCMSAHCNGITTSR